MSYESVTNTLKELGKMVDDLKYGFRTLKSTKEINRRRTMHTILERAQRLRDQLNPLTHTLDALIEDCKQQVNVSSTENSPTGIPYTTLLTELVSKRTSNAMKSIDIITLGDLAGIDQMFDLMRAKGFGKVGFDEIEGLLDKAGIEI
jgi:hypothetical protein